MNTEELTRRLATMRRSVERYHHLSQYAPDAYLLADLGGIIREAAAAGFLQKPLLPEDLSGLLQLVSGSTPT